MRENENRKNRRQFKLILYSAVPEGLNVFYRGFGFFGDVLGFCDSPAKYDFYHFVLDHDLQIGYALLWIFGILGNLINMAVFGHKNMKHPINSILWWLSVSDLLELVAISLYQWCSDWVWYMSFYQIYIAGNASYSKDLLLLGSIYSIQVFHTITVGLNITLVFWRYLAVAHPLLNKFRCDNHSVKLAVVWLYGLSFGLNLPIFYALKVTATSYPHAVHLSDKPFVSEVIIFCGVFLRLGPFVVLTVISVMLTFAVVKSFRTRRDLGVQVSHLSEQQRRMNRMNASIMTIVMMFLITETPIMLGSLIMLVPYGVICEEMASMTLLPVFLVNSSYNVVCYLITSTQYRKTLKSLLRKKCRRVSSSKTSTTGARSSIQLPNLVTEM